MPPRTRWFVVCLSLLFSLVLASPLAAVPASSPAGSQPALQEEQEGSAQEPEQAEVEEVITVTATRFPAPVADLGASVSVVTAEDIRAMGAQWLPDVLEGIPGVTTVQSGPPGAVTSVFLRGAESNHTLVLVDGVKVNSPTTGGYDFSLLPAESIERIEVVRGPQSTLYGSDAIGGVIHVVTTAPSTGQRLSVHGEAGSFGTVRGGLSASGAAGELLYAAGVQAHEGDGFSAAAAPAGQLEPDGYRNLALQGRLRYGWDDDRGVSAFLTYLDADADIDDFAFGIGPIDDPVDTQETSDLYAGLRLDHRSGDWLSRLTLSATELELDTLNPNNPFFSGFSLDAALREADWQNELRLGDSHTLIAGAEFRQEDAETLSRSPFGDSGFDRDVDFFGLYAQDRIALGDRFHLTAGGRFEHHQEFGDHATYRVAASATLAEGLRLHGSVASGFRAPTFNELFFPGFGNPDLEPETSVGFDAGVEARLLDGRLIADVTWFRNDVEDLVQFGVRGFENIGEITTQGVETRVVYTLGARAEISGSWTLTDTEEEATGSELLRRPRHRGSVAVRLRPHERVVLFSELRSKGARFDLGPTGRVQLESFALLNAAAEIDIVDGLSATVRADNLLDEDYTEVFGFQTAGASAYAGVRWSWSR